MGIIKKYNKYLESVEEISLDKVFDDCKPFINDLKKCKKGDFLLRGVGNNNMKPFDIKKFDAPYERIPRNMPIEDHDTFNFLLKQKFGWYVRDGVFCFGYNLNKRENLDGKKEDVGYGIKTFIMFPLGNYKFVYHPEINDLFVEYNTNKIPEIIDTYKNTSLENAIYYGNEISIGCEEYYLIEQSYLKELIKKIWQ